MAHEVVIPLQRKFWYVQIKKREPLFSEVVLLRRRKKKIGYWKKESSKAKASTAVNRFLWKLLVILQTQMLAKMGR